MENASDQSGQSTGRLPSGTELMADLRRRLDGFWNHPKLIARDQGTQPRQQRTAVTLHEIAQAHLQSLPTSSAAPPDQSLHLLGTWTTRNGHLIEMEGQGRALPDDDHLLVLTLATTITSVDEVLVDTHVALFEIVSEP